MKLYLLWAIFFTSTELSLVAARDYYMSNVDAFCQFVPTDSQINSFKKECSKCTTLTKALFQMRVCCDKTTDYRVKCLEKARMDELEVMERFLYWKEGEKRDQMYIDHLGNCSGQYEQKINQLKCNLPMNPMAPFSEYCSDKNSDKCQQSFPLKYKELALKSMCVSNKPDTNTQVHTKMDTVTTVHYRCFEQQALTAKYKSVNELATSMNVDCLKGEFGFDASISLFEQEQYYLGIGSVWEQFWMSNRDRHFGITDDIDVNAESYLNGVCNKSDSYNLSRNCLETPITETFLTFESTTTMKKQEADCCMDVKLPLSETDSRKLKNCLQENKLYSQFYPLNGLFMRSLVRVQTGVMMECESADMFHRGIDPKYKKLTMSEMTSGYGGGALNPWKYEQKLALNSTITPVSYHFFLRDFARSTKYGSDPYYKAACDACTLGESLAQQAFVYPSYTCSALVADALYKPEYKTKTCPDKLFYKAQVAHYCCVDRAMDLYNLGTQYDPKNCPDLTGFFCKNTQ